MGRNQDKEDEESFEMELQEVAEEEQAVKEMGLELANALSMAHRILVDLSKHMTTAQVREFECVDVIYD
jgi:uncharacterized SAM-dependent methyltransferase